MKLRSGTVTTHADPTYIEPVELENRVENQLLNSAKVAKETDLLEGEDRASLPFDKQLKAWRNQRHLSQNDLAKAANVSTRHVSFLETGRARPSRKMVLRLSEVLDIPFRGRNALLESAGYEPCFSETALEDPEFLQVSETLDFVLEGHDPYPAVVLDNHWNVVRANLSGRRLLSFLMDGNLERRDGSINIVDWITDENGLIACLENWPVVVEELRRRIERRIELEGSSPELETMREKLNRVVANRPSARLSRRSDAGELFVPFKIRKGGLALNVHSMITKVGDPRDVTLQEMTIETLCPADQETAFVLKALHERH
jgi:transcriptional regulator with XRE-family HTH domain